MEAARKGVAAMLASFGYRKKGPPSSHGRFGEASIDPALARARENARGAQTWLREFQKIDFRTQGFFDDEILAPPCVQVPIYDTATKRLHLSFDYVPIEIFGRDLLQSPCHLLSFRMETSKDASAVALKTSALPSYVMALGVFVVSPLGKCERNSREKSNFIAVVDTTNPLLPLWAIWAYSSVNSLDWGYEYNPLDRRDPFFDIFPFPCTTYDAVFLGHLGDTHLGRSGTLFPLKKVLQNAERTRGVHLPSLHFVVEQEAEDAIKQSWEANKLGPGQKVKRWFRQML